MTRWQPSHLINARTWSFFFTLVSVCLFVSSSVLFAEMQHVRRERGGNSLSASPHQHLQSCCACQKQTKRARMQAVIATRFRGKPCKTYVSECQHHRRCNACAPKEQKDTDTLVLESFEKVLQSFLSIAKDPDNVDNRDEQLSHIAGNVTSFILQAIRGINQSTVPARGAISKKLIYHRVLRALKATHHRMLSCNIPIKTNGHEPE